MSEEQLKAFLEAVKADAELQEMLEAAKDVDAVVAIAKAAGFVISAEELKRAQADLSVDLSDEELEGVAGELLVTPQYIGCLFFASRDTDRSFARCGGKYSVDYGYSC